MSPATQNRAIEHFAVGGPACVVNFDLICCLWIVLTCSRLKYLGRESRSSLCASAGGAATSAGAGEPCRWGRLGKRSFSPQLQLPSRRQQARLPLLFQLGRSWLLQVLSLPVFGRIWLS